jgi:bacterioferritin
MSKHQSNEDKQQISRDHLAELLNEDLSREYQAIIAYVVYPSVARRSEAAMRTKAFLAVS